MRVLLLSVTMGWVLSAQAQEHLHLLPLPELERRAATGEVAAQAALAACLRWGNAPTEADLARAAQLALTAADQGHVDALRLAADLLREGVGLPKDLAKARDYYAKGAAKTTGDDADLFRELQQAVEEELDAAEGLTKARAALATSTPAQDPAAHLALAQALIEARQDGTEGEIVSHLRQAAAGGLAEAMSLLAWRLENWGPGDEEALTEAVTWQRKAADAGHPAANAAIAFRLARNLPTIPRAQWPAAAAEAERRFRVSGNVEEADDLKKTQEIFGTLCARFDALEAKAKAGDGAAQEELAHWLAGEEVLGNDPVAAVRWYEVATAQHRAGAATAMAHMAAYGLHGVPQDAAAAFRYRAIAIEHGADLAAYADNLHAQALALASGVGTDQDLLAAQALAVRAVAADQARATRWNIQPDGRLRATLHDLERALAPLTPAEAHRLGREGTPEGLARLAAAAARSDAAAVATMERRAVLAQREQDLKVRAEAGENGAPFALGQLYADPHEPRPQDPVQARRWYTAAGTAGVAAALESLGGFCLTGFGGPVSVPEAVAWFTKAEAAGSRARDAHRAQVLNALGTVPLDRQPLEILLFLAQHDHVQATVIGEARTRSGHDDHFRFIAALQRVVRLGEPAALVAWGHHQVRRLENAKAVALWQRAAENGSDEAQALLAQPAFVNQSPDKGHLIGLGVAACPNVPEPERSQLLAKAWTGSAMDILAVSEAIWRQPNVPLDAIRGADRFCRFVADGRSEYRVHAVEHLVDSLRRQNRPQDALEAIQALPEDLRPSLAKRLAIVEAEVQDERDRAAGRLDRRERDRLAQAQAGDVDAMFQHGFALWLKTPPRPVLGIFVTSHEADQYEAQRQALEPVNADGLAWITKAADHGHATACVVLSDRARKAGDLRTARRHLERGLQAHPSNGPLTKLLAEVAAEELAVFQARLIAAERDPALAFTVAQEYLVGVPGVAPDRPLAIRWFGRTRSPGGLINAALLSLLPGDLPPSIPTALAYLDQAGDDGRALALATRLRIARALAPAQESDASVLEGFAGGSHEPVPYPHRPICLEDGDRAGWHAVSVALANLPAGPERAALAASVLQPLRGVRARVAERTLPVLPLYPPPFREQLSLEDQTFLAEFPDMERLASTPVYETRKVEVGAPDYVYDGMFMKMVVTGGGTTRIIEERLTNVELSAAHANKARAERFMATAKQRQQEIEQIRTAQRQAHDQDWADRVQGRKDAVATQAADLAFCDRLLVFTSAP